jgi:DNA invertase Pin-like site-specific DNA recombinase
MAPNQGLTKKGGPVPAGPAKIGYARVSTDMQTVEAQMDALQAAGCRRVFTDEGVSAVAAKRPGLARARRSLRLGDVFVVWAIDRAFRSTIEAILFLDALRAEGIQFRSLMQAIDTTTPEGRKWFIDTASWAEYERAIISRRTKEQMAAAKRRGRHLGRLADDTIREAHARVRDDGVALSPLAGALGVSEDALRSGFARLGLAAQACSS